MTTRGDRVSVAAVTGCTGAMEREALSFLGQLVDLQGGSEDKAAVDRVGRLLAEAFVNLGFELERVPQPRFGDHLVLRNHGGDQGLVLAGHIDTTFTDYEGLPTFRVEQGRAVGPGTADMRGGLVVILYALRCLEQLGVLARLPLTVVLTSDEERGSVTSRDLFYQIARRTRYAMVFECGGPRGELVVGRRGKLSGRVEVLGRAGHAAGRGVKKASAVLEMAHKVIALEELNDARHGTTLNVGRVSGGIVGNTFPKDAAIDFDVRHLTADDRLWVEQEVGRIVQRSWIEQSRSSWRRTSERPVWAERDDGDQAHLIDVLRGAAGELGQPFAAEFRWGTSDANFFAEKGVATVDGVGPVGFEDHSEREHILVETLVPRIQLTALAVARLFD